MNKAREKWHANWSRNVKKKLGEKKKQKKNETDFTQDRKTWVNLDHDPFFCCLLLSGAASGEPAFEKADAIVIQAWIKNAYFFFNISKKLISKGTSNKRCP